MRRTGRSSDPGGGRQRSRASTTTIGKPRAALCRRGTQRAARRRGYFSRRRDRAASRCGQSARARRFAAQRLPGADPGAVVFDALQAARASAGSTSCSRIPPGATVHSQSHLMEELKKVRRVIQRVDASAPHEVLLVLDANQGQNALAQAQQFQQAVGVTGLVLTKLDAHRPGRHRDRHRAAAAGYLIRFIGVGESAGGLPASSTPEAFAAALLVRDSAERRLRRRRPGGRGMITAFRPGEQTLPQRDARPSPTSASTSTTARWCLPHRPLRRRQEHGAQADRAPRAPDACGNVVVHGQVNTRTLKTRHIAAFPAPHRRGVRRTIGCSPTGRCSTTSLPALLAVAATPLKGNRQTLYAPCARSGGPARQGSARCRSNCRSASSSASASRARW